MQTTAKPHLHPLPNHGYIQGLTIFSKDASDPANSNPICHFYGGVRYALPPQLRWRKASKLPADYSYGTREEPGRCDGGAGVCPQVGFLGPPDESCWSEDCFQCNVYVPVGEAPKQGWPVLFYIHGGWLQFGSPNSFTAVGLLSESPVNAIVVMPAYRLNVFGFVYSSELEHDAASVGETTGNHGFWDQRLALEWTREFIGCFGGDGGNVTVAGYSAGAYSVFHQLAYDLNQPPNKAIIKQACMWSNSPAVQPKHPPEAQSQFSQLLSTLQIPLSLPSPEILTRLRSIPARDLLKAATSIPLHQYRPTADGGFVSTGLFEGLDSGVFARQMRERGIRLLLGETRDEPNLYGQWFPPEENTLPALRERLCADYPRSTVNSLLPLYTTHSPTGEVQPPPGCKNWNKDTFSLIYADMQVYKTQRGFLHALVTGGLPESAIHRYRVEMRLKCVDAHIPPEWGVTHATDHYIWFWGNGEVVLPWEKGVIAEALVGPLARLVQGQDEDIGWGTKGVREIRVLESDGGVRVREDEGWDEAVRVWGVLRRVKDVRL